MSGIKEIWLYHHSHLDVGYTHTQPALWELQKTYIDQAIALCEQTAHLAPDERFYWTCEATSPVMKWLETAKADDIKRFAHFLRNGQICISALSMHTSPSCNAEQLARMLYPVKQLREQFGIPLRTAINHDINGQPWMLAQVMIDAGIELYSTGINIHFGGIPLQRPSAFHWQAPDGRKLMTFHGEHYSMFTQICNLWEMNTSRMKEGIDRYINRLVGEGYKHDFIYLSSTNIPDLDNTPPDPQLLTMIRKWNDEGHEQKIRLVTPEILLDKLRTLPTETIQTHAGDWTDYWNFGAASSTYETKLNRRSKISLYTADFLAAQEMSKSTISEQHVLDEAWEQVTTYDEHTWGANASISNPDSWFVKSQWMHKAHSAYMGNSLAGYAMNNYLEKLAHNPLQSEGAQGVLMLNSTAVQQVYDLRISEHFLNEGRQTSAGRFHDHDTNVDTTWTLPVRGTFTIAPYSYQLVPVSQLSATKQQADRIQVRGDTIDTPYYEIHIDRVQGKIVQLIDKSTGWKMLNSQSKHGLFEYVYETIDESKNKVHRTTLFPRDVDKGNNSISCWNHEWSALRRGSQQVVKFDTTLHGSGISLTFQYEAPGVHSLEQTFTFFENRAEIEMVATMDKLNVRDPESIYFTVPLQLNAGWKSVFDTAGSFVQLDEEQLPGVCRDWVTVDQTVSVYDQQHGVTLACVDAPLVQIGDFNFGKEQKMIPRNANPLLLAWPLNNYWDTNFQASQSGKISVKYVLSPFEKFSKENALQAGIQAAYPVQVFPVMHCTEKQEASFFQVKGEGVFVTHVKPSEDQEGMVIRLSNLNDRDTAIEVTFARDVKEVKLTDVLENSISSSILTSKRTCVTNIGPRRIMSIKIKF